MTFTIEMPVIIYYFSENAQEGSPIDMVCFCDLHPNKISIMLLFMGNIYCKFWNITIYGKYSFLMEMFRRFNLLTPIHISAFCFSDPDK